MLLSTLLKSSNEFESSHFESKNLPTFYRPKIHFIDSLALLHRIWWLLISNKLHRFEWMQLTFLKIQPQKPTLWLQMKSLFDGLDTQNTKLYCKKSLIYKPFKFGNLCNFIKRLIVRFCRFKNRFLGWKSDFEVEFWHPRIEVFGASIDKFYSFILFRWWMSLSGYF